MASLPTLCTGCTCIEYDIITASYKNNENSLKLLVDHGVLPDTCKCTICGSNCYLRKDRNIFVCNGTYLRPKTKKRVKCSYSVSRYNGTFLAKTQLEPWQIVCYINAWIRKTWCHSIALDNLKMTAPCSGDWRSFCSEVTLHFIDKQEAIGGPGIVVEIDETFIVKRKYDRGRVLSQTWIFGGIERESKKAFIIPLYDNENKRIMPRTADILIPLIKKYIKPNSTIISDGWAAYRTIGENDYIHKVINHSKEFVSNEDKAIHTQNIERLWRDLKEWIKRPGIAATYLHQYVGRYLFARFYGNESLHHFLITAADLYPFRGDKIRPASLEEIASDESDEED